MPEPQDRTADFEETSAQERGGRDATSPPKRYLFVIGIDKYANHPGLNNAVEDAKEVLKVLLDKYDFYDPRNSGIEGEYNKKTMECHSLLTKFLIDPPKKAIKDHIKALRTALTKHDDVLFYFAGHGGSNATGFYVIPNDGEKGDDETWLDIKKMVTELTMTDKEERLTKNLLMILDCCFSGSALNGIFVGKGSDKISRYLIASALEDEKSSDGRPGQGSPFRHAFCELLMENQEDTYIIDEIKLRQKFERHQGLQNLQTRQKIVCGSLPTDYGNGHGDLIFELREKGIPPVDGICQCFIKHLNFDYERNQFGPEIVDKSRLGFISLYEDREHLILMKKAINDVMASQFEGYIFSINRISPLRDDQIPEGGIWEYLWRVKKNIQGDDGMDQALLEPEKIEIMKWLFDQAHSESQSSKGIQLFNIHMESKNQLALQYIWNFCQELPFIYEKIENETGRNNRLILILTELKKEHPRLIARMRENANIVDTIGIVDSMGAAKIKKSALNKWWGGVKGSIQKSQIQEINQDNIYEAIFKDNDDEGLPVNKFIEASCQYLFKDSYDHKREQIKQFLFTE